MAAEPESDLVNHSPDEVCVLVRSPGQTDPPLLYEQVRRALNAALRDILSEAQSTA